MKKLSFLNKRKIRPSRLSSNGVTWKSFSTHLCFIAVPLCTPSIPFHATWIQNGVTVAGGNGQGNAVNQLSGPYGLCVDENQTVYVADCGNHRIVE